ncbi:MAG: hypothetical protein HYY18_12350 [Planctomycetes bacterium]|nr:hypothetical protein [Planctomycetota bacterium]
MFAITLTVGIVVVVTCAWMFSRAGSAAFDLCARNPRVFLPGLLVLGASFLISEAPREMAAAWTTWRLPGLTLSPSFTLLLSLAAHVLGAAWLFSLLGRALNLPARPFARTAGATLAALASFWVGMFASMIPLTAFVKGGSEVLIGALLVWAVGLWWINARLAPFPAALFGDPRRGVFGRMSDLYAAEAPRYRVATAVHLLALGMVTYVYYSTSGPQVGFVPLPGTTQESWKFNVDAQCALNLTVANGWPKVIQSVTKHEMPAALAWAVKALTVAVSTIFIAGYAALGARRAPNPTA